MIRALPSPTPPSRGAAPLLLLGTFMFADGAGPEAPATTAVLFPGLLLVIDETLLAPCGADDNWL